MVIAVRAPGAARRMAQAGFTAIELMTVVTILAVLAAIAAPSMRELVLTSRVRAAASELHATLVRARSEAITRNAQIDVVPAAGGWANGWQLLAGATPLESRPVLEAVEAVPAAPATISYRVDGRISAGQQVIVFSVPSAAAVKARCVTLDASGRASVRVDKDGDPSNGCG